MTTQFQSRLDKAVQALREQLGENLYSCCLYGSAVRGNFIDGVSDINLLIVLHESNPAAHHAVAQAICEETRVDPFILGRAGFDRSARAFAAKFSSIKRNYRVLHGADPLLSLQFDPAQERFLCEQALRNLRLRLVFAFVTSNRNKSFHKFIQRSVTPLFVRASEALRLEGKAVPKDFEDRIGLMEEEFKIDGAVLRELIAFKQDPRKLSSAETIAWHQRLFPAIDSVVKWIEAKWTD